MKRAGKILSMILAAVMLMSSLCITSFAAATLSAPKVTITSTTGTNPAIKLKWSAVSGAKSYYIYRSDYSYSDMSYYAKTSANSFLDKDVKQEKTYYYTVYAVDANGKKSDASNEVNYILLKLSAPVIIINGIASDKIKISYDAVKAADKYYIYMSTNGGKYKLIAKTENTSYTVSKLDNTATYSFKVKAVAVRDFVTYKSAYSNIAKGTVKLPATILAEKKLAAYKPYMEQMEKFYYADVYDNRYAGLSETVGKSEALKLARAAVVGYSDYYIYTFYDTDYPNQEYVSTVKILQDEEYNPEDYEEIINSEAYQLFGFLPPASEVNPDYGIGDEVNADNYSETASYGQFVKWIVRLKRFYLDIEPISAGKDVIAKGADCDDETRAAFSDLVASGIIKTVTENIDPSAPLTKALVNEIFMNMHMKFNYISYNGDAIRLDNLPENADFYPYILEGFTNKEYEYPVFEGIFGSAAVESAAELYDEYEGKKWRQVSDWSKIYLETLYSVDYRTINFDDYYWVVDEYMCYKHSEESIKEYIDYVKKNHIVINTTVTPIEPCLYYDGFGDYYVRNKVEIEIVSSDTKNNLLYGDSGIKYKAKKYTLYVDLNFIMGFSFKYGTVADSDNLYINYSVDTGMGSARAPIWYYVVNLDEVKNKLVFSKS